MGARRSDAGWELAFTALPIRGRVSGVLREVGEAGGAEDTVGRVAGSAGANPVVVGDVEYELDGAAAASADFGVV